jgi:MATE family multidrug resistance protein
MSHSSSTNTGLHRQIWMMAAPIILANVSVPLLGAVNTAVVGHLDAPHYIGAVAIGAMLFNFIYHLFNCLRMGTTGPTAQARGAGDAAEVRAMIGRALLLALAAGAMLLLLHRPLLDAALWLIEARAPVEQHAREYFLIRAWALPAVLGSYAIVGWLYGLRDARTPLALLVLTNGANIVLSVLFVHGFGWGVPGVAWASLIAEYAGFAAGLWCVLHALGRLPAANRRAALLDRERLQRMLAINGDLVLRTFCVVSVMALFMAQSAGLGDLPLAANQVLHTFLMFTSFGLDGLAHAAEAILGESAGRRDREGFRRGLRAVLGWSFAVGAANCAIYLAAGSAIIALLTSQPEVRMQAEAWLLWPALMPLISVWAYCYDGVYLAATRTRPMRNIVLLAFAAFLAVLFGAAPFFGNAGLWAAVTVFLGLRGLLQWWWLPRVVAAV